ncbi:6-phosphogluconolactonase-like [Gigantopelta aegis]|uniref:6-phosphogluconolactonase-like n=1 Tax=Gigantopelta aegis TaxID=1735272 RepID=UPI001B88E3E6|nr:6-phosphogluconolactonase-like [Gigantopelta aegis]
MSTAKIRVLDSDKAVSLELCSFVINKANDAIKRNGAFFVGVSGGSVAKFLCQGLPSLKTDWSKWHIFFCDERHVPFTDSECTYSYYKQNLMSKVALPEENIFPINPDISVEDAATEYSKKITSLMGSAPRFDVLLLGMGPDGHTCSLFPGHKLVQEKEKIVAAITDSPKPPPCRVTLTFPTINNSACAVFASCGAGKADIVKKVLEPEGGEPLPAAMVQPSSGELVWFLDRAAASLLVKQS